MEFRFEAEIIYWRGPSPFFYAPLPQTEAERVRGVARAVTYGWGVIPVEATINGATFTTSLFPKDGTYLLPIKAAVRKRAEVTAGDVITVEMTIAASER